MSHSKIDRRELLIGAGAAIAVAALPAAIAAELPRAGGALAVAPLADWHVDDMWGVYPRPSEPIGYGRPQGDGERLAAVHPADLPFLV